MEVHLENLDDVLLNPLAYRILTELRGYQFREVSPRGVRTIEALGVMLRIDHFLINEDNLKKSFPAFSLYMAKARTECIRSGISLDSIIDSLMEDLRTRRAFLYTYDWHWSDHPECVLGIQFLVRPQIKEELYTFAFLRASDLGRALAYDLYAFSKAAEEVSSEIGVEPKEVVLLISSAHFYPDDPETPDWLRGRIY